MTDQLEFFMSKVEKTDDGCWTWRGKRAYGGYGAFWYEKHYVGAHRAAYEFFVGPIPAGLVIDHLCRNRACVNPEHLEPVTTRENTLRGVGTTALKAKQTHCLRGHALTPDNLISRSTERRRWCRLCATETQRERRARKRAAA